MAITALAAGCVEERVVYDRPVVVEHPVQRGYLEFVISQPSPEQVVEVEPA